MTWEIALTVHGNGVGSGCYACSLLLALSRNQPRVSALNRRESGLNGGRRVRCHAHQVHVQQHMHYRSLRTYRHVTILYFDVRHVTPVGRSWRVHIFPQDSTICCT